MRILLEAGANPHLADDEGDNVFHTIATRRDKYGKEILGHEVDVDDAQTAILRALFQAKVSLDAVNNGRETDLIMSF